MALQTLPSTARSYSAAQLAEIEAATLAVADQWQRVGTSFDAGWMLIRPTVAAIVLQAQQRLVQRASEYVPALLEATGQTAMLDTVADANTSPLVGLTGAGYQVADSLNAAPIRAKQAVENGRTAIQALDLAGSWLTGVAGTILADTARSAESLNRYTRNVGYIRMVNSGACGRCVVQAGKWFRTNQGFLRHPRCKCVHVPASEDVAGDWQTNPDAYFHSLDKDSQAKLVGSQANAQAIRDGADINQVVNAYRKSSGMSFAQGSPIKVRNGLKYSTEGTTRRAVAAQQQVALRRNGPLQQRLMPESIAMRATSDADRIRLLKLNGWITDDSARTQGRAIFAEQRRIERNARARARTAERRAAN